MAAEPAILARQEDFRAASIYSLPESSEDPRPRNWSARPKAWRNFLGARLNRLGLERTDFTVISNDCWGQALCEEWGLPCRTPMAGSGMHADCFLRFLEDIPGFLSAPLCFIPVSRHLGVKRMRMRREPWPMATLRGEVEIHFMHFRSEDEARSAWKEGCRQVNLDRLAVKFTADKDGASAGHIARFQAMAFERKLLISKFAHPEVDCAIQVPNYVINGAMMFRRSLRHFDCAHWLNTGQVKRRTARVMANKLLYMRGV